MLSPKHKHWVYGGLILLGGIVVIIWMKNYLVNKGVLTGTQTTLAPDPLGIGKLQLQTWFTTTVGAQPGTTAFPSQLQ